MKAVALLILLGILMGCLAPPALTTNTRPPGGATNMTNVHNGWHTFEWRGECFLMKSGGKGDFGIGHITTISCGDEDED